MQYFSKHNSMRNLNALKNVKLGNFLVQLSNCDWLIGTDHVDLTCRMLIIGILLRPNYILKEHYTQGIFRRKMELAIDEPEEEEPDKNVEYLRDYFDKEKRDDDDKSLGKERMIELTENLFDSNEIESYCKNKNVEKRELCYFVVAKMCKLYNNEMIGKMISNATVFERKVSAALESFSEMNENKEKHAKIVKQAKQDLCKKEIIEEYIRKEFKSSFELMITGFFRHLPEKILYVETLIEVLGGQTNERNNCKENCGEIDDQMKVGVEQLMMVYLHNNISYTKDKKHRNRVCDQEMENFLFSGGLMSLSNNRWFRPILLRSTIEEWEVEGGDGSLSRFSWSTRNYYGQNQNEPRGFVQNKRFRPAEPVARRLPDASRKGLETAQNEAARPTGGVQNIPQYVMTEPVREEIEWLEN